jgi:hypothetical protein
MEAFPDILQPSMQWGTLYSPLLAFHPSMFSPLPLYRPWPSIHNNKILDIVLIKHAWIERVFGLFCMNYVSVDIDFVHNFLFKRIAISILLLLLSFMWLIWVFLVIKIYYIYIKKLKGATTLFSKSRNPTLIRKKRKDIWFSWRLNNLN